ncbi:hypothetical protein WHX55_22620 [Pseudomonas fluorescens]|uniref:hypothetical protein n=1 Tax=Pseudomonas fluorescens TaxID=294 RepID=UPI003248DF0A
MLKTTKEQRIEAMLRDLQLEAERGNAEQRLRGRLILRGVRSGLYAATVHPSVAEMAELLREELFGQQPVL